MFCVCPAQTHLRVVWKLMASFPCSAPPPTTTTNWTLLVNETGRKLHFICLTGQRMVDTRWCVGLAEWFVLAFCRIHRKRDCDVMFARNSEKPISLAFDEILNGHQVGNACSSINECMAGTGSHSHCWWNTYLRPIFSPPSPRIGTVNVTRTGGGGAWNAISRILRKSKIDIFTFLTVASLQLFSVLILQIAILNGLHIRIVYRAMWTVNYYRQHHLPFIWWTRCSPCKQIDTHLV